MSKRTSKEYRTATEAEAEELMILAKQWFFHENPADMFASMAPTARLVVAEYLANQQGLTLYELTPYEEPQDD